MAQVETLLNYMSGLVRGNTVDTLGLPVDLANMALKPIGLGHPKPIGGSAHLRELFGQPPEPASVAEVVGSLVSVSGAAKAMMLPAVLRQHGTARKFEKFSKDFYMSGEGAQAFGEGIYTTEKLGKHYAEVAYNANKLRAEKASGEISALEWKLRDRFAPGKQPMSATEAKETGDRIRQLKKEQEAAMKSVSKYNMTVELPAGEWLNWDKANPDVVSKYRQLQDLGVTPEMTGKQIYKQVQDKLPQASASDYLDAIGIRGHIFLDEGSRSVGKGTSNQVTYNPERLKVVEAKEL